MTDLKKAISVGLVLAIAAPVPAVATAGEVLLIGPHNTQLLIACDDVTCDVRERRLDGHWRQIEAMECGRDNFNLLEFKYRAAGYH